MLEVPSPLPELWVMWAQQSLATASTRVSWGSWNYDLILLIRLPRPSLRGRARTAHTHTHTHAHTRTHAPTACTILLLGPKYSAGEIQCSRSSLKKKKKKEKTKKGKKKKPSGEWFFCLKAWFMCFVYFLQLVLTRARELIRASELKLKIIVLLCWPRFWSEPRTQTVQFPFKTEAIIHQVWIWNRNNIWDVCSGFLSQAAKTSRKHYLIYLQNIFAEKVGETATSTVTLEIQKHRTESVTYPSSPMWVCHYK